MAGGSRVGATALSTFDRGVLVLHFLLELFAFGGRQRALGFILPLGCLDGFLAFLQFGSFSLVQLAALHTLADLHLLLALYIAEVRRWSPLGKRGTWQS